MLYKLLSYDIDGKLHNSTTSVFFFTEVQNHVYELMENTNWFNISCKTNVKQGVNLSST